MTKKKNKVEEMMLYRIITTIFVVLVIMGFYIMFWYITLPISLVICGIYLLSKRRKKEKKRLETLFLKQPATQQPINNMSYICLYCGMETDSNKSHCKFCGSEKEQQKRHIPKAVQREVWRRDLGKCVECSSKIRLEYDHIIPFSKGGSNTVRNIQLLCETCNRKKHNKI